MQPLWIAIRALAGDGGNEVIDAISKELREEEEREHVPAHLTDEWPETISETEGRVQ